MRQRAEPRSGSILADVLLAVLERGIVVGLRLVGPPGDRKLLVGLGMAGSFDPVLLALGITGHLGGRRNRYGGVYGYDEHDPYDDDPYEDGPYGRGPNQYQPYA